MTFWKWQNIGENKKVSSFHGLGSRVSGGMNRWHRTMKLFCFIIRHIIIYFFQTHKIYNRVNPKINYRLWMIMMWIELHLRNKCTTLESDVDNGGDYSCVGVRGIWEIAITSFQFCCESQTALRKLLWISNCSNQNTIQTVLI